MFNRLRVFLLSDGKEVGKLSFAISLFWAIVFYLLIGLEWDFYDGFVTNFPSGYLTGKPYGDFYIYGFALMSYLYAFLHSMFQPVPWFGLFSICFFIVSSKIIIDAFLNLLQKKFIKIWQLLLLGSILFLLLFISSLTALSLTGISFLCCGAALIGISGLNKCTAENVFPYVGLLIVYTWGFLMRFESGLGASLIVGVFIVLNTNSFKRILKILLPPALIAMSILYYIQQIAKSVPFLYNTEAAMVYVADGVNNPDYYYGKSAKDSIKIRAIKGFFMNDEEELTEEFINNLLKQKKQALGLVEVSFQKQISKAWAITLPCVKADWSTCAVNVILFLAILILYIKNRCSTYSFARLIFFQFFFWFAIFAVAYWVKMEYRHFDPMMQLYSICNLLFLFHHISKHPLISSARVIRLFLFWVLILFAFKLQSAVSKSSGSRRMLQAQRYAVDEVNKICAGKILLLDVNSRQVVHGNVFSVVKFPAVQKILFYDMGELPIIPGYKKVLDKACGCNSSKMKDFYRYLYQNKKNVVILSAESRVELISGYLQLVHGINYSFVRLKGDYEVNNIASPGGNLNYYVIQ